MVVTSDDIAERKPDLCIVAVGAMMVGKIKLKFDDLTTRTTDAASPRRDYPVPGVALKRGEEWGHFEFGSTLVVVAAPDRLTLESRPPGTPLRLGEEIGCLAAPSEPVQSEA